MDFPRSKSLWSAVFFIVCGIIFVVQPAYAQVPPPNMLPTDVTPLIFSGERQYQSQFQYLQYAMRKKLPSRLTYSFVNEVSQRLETNVFQTNAHTRQDYVFRELPTVTLGWQIEKSTNIYCNWFLIKDVFAKHYLLSQPTTQSLSFGINHNFQLGRKTTLQPDWQARELWQARRLRQFDMLNSISLTHTVSQHLVLFSSALLQLRGARYFEPAQREIDPFFSWGFMYRRGLWTLSATSTYILNFRNDHAIPPQSNQSMIADFEINRPVSKRAPYLVAFIRAEPIWNWDSQKFPGLSGFDFRLYGGLRFAFAKQPYNARVDDLRKQLIEEEREKEEQKQQQQIAPPSS